jgi:hypothetical protein
MRRSKESGHWHPERWGSNETRVWRYLRHLHAAALNQAMLFLGPHDGRLAIAEFLATQAAQLSAAMLRARGVETLGERAAAVVHSSSHEKPRYVGR